MSGRLEELELSAEEAERLQRAFRDQEFRALLAEYAAELNDPEQRRLYEEEVTALERERGVEIRFVHPEPGYVLRTSQAGSHRCYLNVCSNPYVAAPQTRAEPGGHRWALPYSLAPGREELGRGGRRRTVYDVVFHPAALRLASRYPRFRRLLSDTALEAVERHWAVQLDRANAAVLRGAKYKGIPQAPVIRTPLPAAAPRGDDDDDSPLPPFPIPPPASPRPPPAAPPPEEPRPSGPTTPRWSIRHRSYVDLQDYRCCRHSAPSPVPRELLVTVELPLLSSAAQAELEIRGRELRLDSQRPAYRLRLRLPYHVDEKGGRAAFNKAQRQLLVTLPVVPGPAPQEPPGPERLEEAEAAAEEPGEPPEAESEEAAPSPRGPAAGAAGGDPTEPPSAGDSPPPHTEPRPPGEAPPCPPESPAAEGGPGEMSLGRGSGSAQPVTCPPFQCRQDEASLSLLLPVPGIQPRSLSGHLGTNHYSLRFSTDTATYALFLRFPAHNRLAAPESSVSVSAHSAAVALAKAPGSTGLWEKFSFGLDSSAPQERLFLTEENVDGFLDSVLCPSSGSQSALESHPSIEVLDISEERIQIRLKPPVGSECAGETLGSSGGDPSEGTNSDCSQPEAGTNHTAAAPTEPSPTSTAPATARTMGEVGCSSHHCSQHQPPDTAPAVPGGAGREELDLESSGPAGEAASDCDKQAGHGLGEGAGEEAGVAVAAGSERGERREAGGGAASLIPRELSREQGCSFTFQNDFLYSLD